MKPTACRDHKQMGMISNPRQRCSAKNVTTGRKCTHTGTHELNKARYCEEHAPEGAINLAIKPCISCKLLDVLNATQHCSTCDPVHRERATHAKELTIKALFEANDLRFISHDKRVDEGVCYQYRPDFVFDAGTHMVVVEVDENQHKSYP